MNTFSLMLRSDSQQFRSLFRIWWMLLPLPAILFLPMLTPLAWSPRYWTFLRYTLPFLIIARIILLFLCCLRILDKENPADVRAYWRGRPFSPGQLLLEKLWLIVSRLLLPLAAVIALELLLLNSGRLPPMSLLIQLIFHFAAAGLVFLAMLGGRNDREAVAIVLGIPFLLSLLLNIALVNRVFDGLARGGYQIFPMGFPLRAVLILSWGALVVYWIWQRYRLPRPVRYGWLRMLLLMILLRPAYLLQAPPRLPPTVEESNLLHPQAQVNRSGLFSSRNVYHFQVRLHPELFPSDTPEPAALSLRTLHSVSPGGLRLTPPEDAHIFHNPLVLNENPSHVLSLSRNVPPRVAREESGTLKSWIERTPMDLVDTTRVPLQAGARFADQGRRYLLKDIFRAEREGNKLQVQLQHFGISAWERDRTGHHRVTLLDVRSGRRYSGQVVRGSSSEVSGYLSIGTQTRTFDVQDAEISYLVLEILHFRPGTPTVHYVEIPLSP
ncbi:MAG: hypothetical protein JJU29_16095 [Verrucomicrobia bacterium]|nr:hypothetical protein [Verrucomicrobiota bacterium]MCH8510241.1 hypothetical protein [Kiritimatiellia bacterium]